MDRVNIDPKQWGPPAWQFIDAVLVSFPRRALIEDQMWVIEFLTVLGDSLPCEKCRLNYKTFLSLNPVANHVSGRRDVQEWMAAYRRWAKHR